MITPMAAPAINTATTLRLPRSPATVAGNPKIPLPIIEFTTSAVRLQRPIARTNPVCIRPVCPNIIAKPFVSHLHAALVDLLGCFSEIAGIACPARLLT